METLTEQHRVLPSLCLSAHCISLHSSSLLRFNTFMSSLAVLCSDLPSAFPSATKLSVRPTRWFFSCGKSRSGLDRAVPQSEVPVEFRTVGTMSEWGMNSSVTFNLGHALVQLLSLHTLGLWTFRIRKYWNKWVVLDQGEKNDSRIIFTDYKLKRMAVYLCILINKNRIKWKIKCN